MKQDLELGISWFIAHTLMLGTDTTLGFTAVIVCVNLKYLFFKSHGTKANLNKSGSFGSQHCFFSPAVGGFYFFSHQNDLNGLLPM